MQKIRENGSFFVLVLIMFFSFDYIYVMKKLLVLLLLFSVHSFATYVAVLETAADGSAKDSVSLLDRQYLTNVLREQAVKELTAEENFTIMTRENINAMLPPGKAIEDCEGSCLAETGRNIAADYICQARVGRFGKSLTLSAELYETAGNKLVTSFNGRGADVEELLKLIEDRSPAFFHRVKELTGVAANSKKSSVESNNVKGVEPVEKSNSSNENTAQTSLASTSNVVSDTSSSSTSIEESSSVTQSPGTESGKEIASSVNPDEQTQVIPEEQKHDIPVPEQAQDKLAKISLDEPRSDKANVGESIPANVADEPSKKSGIHWVPLSISAVAVAAGTVLAVVGNNKAKDAYDKGGRTVKELEKNKDDAKSGQTLRTVGIGVAIAGAVGVGLSFAF